MSPQSSLPETMRAVVLRAYDGTSLSVETLPMPEPKEGQVLVRMHAAPINPSDVLFTQGQYGVRKPLPCIPGFEGSGTVVRAGGGLWAQGLVGRRVACTATNDSGTWTEYAVADARGCIPLLPSVSLEQGAMLFVNPLTAWAMMDRARNSGAGALIQTAAASALGKMVLRLGQKYGFPVLNIVRRKEQVAQLRSLGADLVLNSSDDGFDEKLRALARDLRATCAIDAVSGAMTEQLAAAMPRGSRILVYGALGNQEFKVHPGTLIFRNITFEGFWLSSWVGEQNPASLGRAAVEIQQMLADTMRSEVRACFPLEETAEAITLYSAAMTEGKVLLMPSLTRPVGPGEVGEEPGDATEEPAAE